MIRLVSVAMLITLALVIFSVVSNQLPSTSSVSVKSQNDELSIGEDKRSINWKETLKSIPAYFKKPEEKKVNQAKPKTKAKPKRKPNEARLIALVNLDDKNKSAGVFLLPRSNELKSLKVGEGWLDAWKLKVVEADYVVWMNTEEKTEIRQKLF